MSERVKGRLEPLGFLARLCQPPFDLAAQLVDRHRRQSLAGLSGFEG